ncbi:hypothetical protein CYMTET_13826 [Cymbomonas tetramitiformis]|uniref:Uncharacterized protein n=1 Tax=Cymbomonas tetramitiformis TaxID=36881 RepID=A0AAE0GHJ8_9CHLO|nr:hypothetical protein CYMTET_13826 [Cymbomonas tetramitiformis]
MADLEPKLIAPNQFQCEINDHDASTFDIHNLFTRGQAWHPERSIRDDSDGGSDDSGSDGSGSDGNDSDGNNSDSDSDKRYCKMLQQSDGLDA